MCAVHSLVLLAVLASCAVFPASVSAQYNRRSPHAPFTRSGSLPPKQDQLDVWPAPRHEHRTPGGSVALAAGFDVQLQSSPHAASQPWFRAMVEDLRRNLSPDVVPVPGSHVAHFELVHPPTSQANVQEQQQRADAVLKTIQIYLAHAEMPAECWQVDESYTLNVTRHAILVHAPQPCGARYAMETLSQLCMYHPSEQLYRIQDAPLTIDDRPAYAWRGVMLDTSRHFLRLGDILRVVRFAAANKLNVLHWHLVDADSFPFVSTSVPGLGPRTAYSGADAVYNHTDVARVVAAAALHGIMVVPEFDMPGHSAAVSIVRPDIVVTCWEFSDNIENFALNPSKPDTYDFVQTLVDEVIDVFPGTHLHFGGDEVSPHCWLTDPDIKAYLKKHGLDVSGLQHEFESKLLDIVRRLDRRRKVVLWAETVLAGHSLPVDAVVVNTWARPEHLHRVTSAGYQAVSNYGWYVASMESCGSRSGNVVNRWHCYYQLDPIHSLMRNSTAAERARVLGGEASAWAENVDGSNLDHRLWVNTAAVAERLWTGAHDANIDAAPATWRLSSWRCKMLRRGARVGPVWADYCAPPTKQRAEMSPGHIDPSWSPTLWRHATFACFFVAFIGWIIACDNIRYVFKGNDGFSPLGSS